MEKTLDLLEGTEHQVHVFDLSLVDEIPRWMKEITSVSGPLYGLVHSAGMQFIKYRGDAGCGSGFRRR